MSDKIDKLPNGLTDLSDHLLCELGNEKLPAMVLVRVDEHRWKFMSNVPHDQHVQFIEEGLEEVADRIRSNEFTIMDRVVPSIQ